jgi:YegS/Rv2252/BmrU family lipid kinase
MKKIKLLYNPLSGDASFKNKLDLVIARFQKEGFCTIPFRLDNERQTEDAFFDIDNSYYAIAACGGDGTLNSIVNIMMKQNINIPLGIFPCGTSNDLANYIGIPRDINNCCDIIINGIQKNIDIGKVNDKYFINVCSAGLLTDVAYKTNTAMKNALGKIAYYIKGIEEVPNFSPIKMKLAFDNNIIEDNMVLIVVLNSSSAGGFTRIAPNATIDDGYLDVIAIKYANIKNMVSVFFKILKGEHINDNNIYYIKTNKILIDCEKHYETDIDGERGPNFPLEIMVLDKALKIFVPNA